MARLRVVLLFLVILGAGPHARQEPAQTPTFRTSVEAVQINVIVTDADGNPVSGLTKDDFELVERGQPRDITTFSAIDIPVQAGAQPAAESDVLHNDRPPGRVYVIALDQMSGEAALRTRHFLREFIEKHFAPDDSAAVVLVTSGSSDASQAFTSNPRLLLKAIDSFGGSENWGNNWTREKNFTGDFKQLVEVIAALPAPRKALILISSNIPGDADRLRAARMGRIARIFSDVNHDFYEAVSLATRHNVAVYPIDPNGISTELTAPGSFDTSAMEARATLTALAEMTGGFALANSNGYAQAFERLVRDNSVYYVLGFEAGEERGTGFASVRVRVKRPGLEVRTLEGYLAPMREPGPARRPSTVMAAAWDAVASPLTSSGVPMRMFAAPYKGRGSDATVAIALEIATSRLDLAPRDGLYRGEMDILFAITDAKGKRRPITRHRAAFALRPETYERVSRGALRVLSQLVLPKGRYQVRASAGGENLAGSVVYDLEVPDFSRDFVVSGLSVTSAQARDTVTVMPHQRIDVGFPGPPTTAREFSRDDTVTLFVEAYENRRKKHTVQFAVEMRDERGQVLDRLQAEQASIEKPKGPSVYTYSPSLLLAEVPAGRYVLQVEARSSLTRDPVVRTVPVTIR